MMLTMGGSHNGVSSEGGDGFDQLEASWLSWVVVTGIPIGTTSTPSLSSGIGGARMGSSSTNKVLIKMQEYGNIVDHALSGGTNWMFIK
jgi:hypothetical protein